MKYAAVLQTRAKNTRLPRKSFLPLLGTKNTHDIMLENFANYNLPVIMAVPKDEREYFEQYENRCKVFYGNPEYPLERVCDAIEKFNIEWVIDVTGDCPLVYVYQIVLYLNLLLNNPLSRKPLLDADYISNTITRSYPDGFDWQIYRGELLLKARDVVKIFENKNHFPHTGWNIVNYSSEIAKSYSFKMLNVSAGPPCFHPDWGVTLDEQRDYENICRIYKYFGETIHISPRNVVTAIYDLDMVNDVKVVQRKGPGV